MRGACAIRAAAEQQIEWSDTRGKRGILKTEKLKAEIGKGNWVKMAEVRQCTAWRALTCFV
jgi:hypothetical protein